MSFRCLARVRCLAAACMTASLLISAASASAASFVSPGYWTVGDTNSTYQAWDFFTSSVSNAPDVGYTTNPSISTGPTVAPIPPGFVTGSGNFYTFAGDHGFKATLYNHGGTSGVGGLPSGSGTHVIVQTSTILNEDDGIYTNTLEVVATNGDPLTGGTNAEALRYGVIDERVISTSMGDATERDEIWEFFLPNFTDDFVVRAQQIIHSSFDELRVDSMIAPAALPITPIPEPGSCILLGLGSLMLVGGLRKRRGRLAA